MTCHDAHASNVAGMIVKQQDQLCYECHSDVSDGLASAKSWHAPATGGECTQCHSPHKARLNHLLLAPSPDLCVSCHAVMKTRLETELVHSPAARDCSRCHVPHFSNETVLLTESVPALCGQCHGFDEAAFAKAHLGIDPAVMDCTSCHNPHYSNDPNFFQEQVHAPFAAGSCEECHIVEEQ
jgi:predicted CXXCH cytochrome family protein